MTRGTQVLLELFLDSLLELFVDSRGHLEDVRDLAHPSSPRGCPWLQKSGFVPRLQPLTHVPSTSIV